MAFDYRHTWLIPEVWGRSSRYWWLPITVSIPEVWLFFPHVLSNGIELDATEPVNNPDLETLQNFNPINHVVQAVYAIPRKSTLSVSLGNAPRCRVESPLQVRDPLRSEYRTLLPSQVDAEVALVTTERLLPVSRKDRRSGRRCV